MKLDVAVFRQVVVKFDKIRQFGKKLRVAGFEIRFVEQLDSRDNDSKGGFARLSFGLGDL